MRDNQKGVGKIFKDYNFVSDPFGELIRLFNNIVGDVGVRLISDDQARALECIQRLANKGEEMCDAKTGKKIETLADLEGRGVERITVKDFITQCLEELEKIGIINCNIFSSRNPYSQLETGQQSIEQFNSTIVDIENPQIDNTFGQGFENNYPQQDFTFL